MRKFTVLFASMLLAIGLMATPVLAHHGGEQSNNPHAGGMTQEEWDAGEAHGHVLVLGLEFDDEGNPISFRKCVDIAGNQALPKPNQHNILHFGKAGQQLAENAGHGVAPTAPWTPWANCAELEEFFR